MTTTEIFARYLGLTPENAPWAYGKRYFYDCRCGKDCYDTAHENDMPECSSCGNAMQYAYSATVLTATSPLAPEPTPGWLEALVRAETFGDLIRQGFDQYATHSNTDDFAYSTNPTHSAARVIMAADSKLREECEQASDWQQPKETPND